MNPGRYLALLPVLAANVFGLTLLAREARMPNPAPRSSPVLAEASPSTAALPPPLPASMPLGIIAERSLFHPSRHAEPPPAAPIAVAAPPAAPLSATITLLGTVGGPGNRIALLKRNGGSEVLRLREGESTNGWEVAKIGATEVFFKQGERRDELHLFDTQANMAPSLGAPLAQPIPTFASQPQIFPSSSIPMSLPPGGLAR
jgi:hypothetical protein